MNLQEQLRDAISAAVSYCVRNDTAFGSYEGVITKAVIDVLEKQEPIKHEFQGRYGTWHSFIDQRHYEDMVADGTRPIRALYAHPVAQPAPSVPDEAAAYSEWFHGQQGVAYDGMWAFARAAWMARAALNAAPKPEGE